MRSAGVPPQSGANFEHLSPFGTQTQQRSLFDPNGEEAAHSSKLMNALNSLNTRFGRDAVFIASAGTH
jgi:hypothetical protein